MPEFSERKYIEIDEGDLECGGLYANVDIDINASDFLDECSEEDIEELIDELEDRGYLNGRSRVNFQFNSFDDDEWGKMVNILSNPYARLRLSNEDIETIKQIADKL